MAVGQEVLQSNSATAKQRFRGGTFGRYHSQRFWTLSTNGTHYIKLTSVPEGSIPNIPGLHILHMKPTVMVGQ